MRLGKNKNRIGCTTKSECATYCVDEVVGTLLALMEGHDNGQLCLGRERLQCNECCVVGGVLRRLLLLGVRPNTFQNIDDYQPWLAHLAYPFAHQIQTTVGQQRPCALRIPSVLAIALSAHLTMLSYDAADGGRCLRERVRARHLVRIA